MTPTAKPQSAALQSALRAARENVKRWREMQAEFSTDSDAIVRYFILSYLRKMELRGEQPTFDQIVLNIMPLLKNGDTPEHQTIRNVLETVADRTHHGQYKLKSANQNVLNL